MHAEPLLGSVSRQVAREAAQPVVVVRATADPPAETVVVGVDDSAAAGSALEVALGWAARHGHSLRVLRARPARIAPAPAVPRPVSAANPDEAMQREQDALTRRLASLVRAAQPAVQVTAEVVPGSASAALVAARRTPRWPSSAPGAGPPPACPGWARSPRRC